MPLLTGPLQPAWIVGRAYEHYLREFTVDETWTSTIRQATARGAVVHLIRNVSLLDLLALEHLTRRLGLPRIGYANELGGWLWPDLRRRTPSKRLRDAIESGGSAVLFMKRSPTVMARVGAARPPSIESDTLLRALMDLQQTMKGEIMLVPETLVWTNRPERIGFSVLDAVFGPADFPGELRAAAQLVLNSKNALIRAGEPLSLREYLAQEAPTDDGGRARRLAYMLLRKVERERRAVLGPVQKPADRVREEILRSPKLQAILRDLAGPDQRAREVLEDKARRMLRELETTPDPETTKGLGMMVDKIAERVYAGVDVDKEGIERVREAARRGSVILLPSHKSHFDYLLLSLVLRKHGLMTPCIAAGDNLAFFPLGPVFRRAGAFFIRRSFRGDRLYTAVVDAYIRRLIRDGFAIEFFLEGGRSRTGKLLPPKVGLLNMVVEAALGIEGRTVSFMPVSIGYERMLEEDAYARELSGGAKSKESAVALLKAGEVLRQKYGRVNVQFGEAIELADLRAEVCEPTAELSPAKRRGLVTRLARRVMIEINRATAVTPGSLVAMTLLCHEHRGLPHVELIAHCARLVKLVQHLGARTAPSLTRVPGDDMRVLAVHEAVRLYVRGRLVRQHVPGDTLTGAMKKRPYDYTGSDAIYSVPDEHRLVLDISKNIIVHLFVDRALVSTVLLTPPGVPITRQLLRERALSLFRLFKYEFTYRVDAPFEQVYNDTVADMIALGEIEAQGNTLVLGPGHHGLDGPGWVAFYASIVRNFLESYRIAARSLRTLVRGPATIRDLSSRALRLGEQMFLGGEIARSEAVSRPTLENAFASFVEEGYLKRASEKLSLAESFESEGAAKAIESRVAAYLIKPPPT